MPSTYMWVLAAERFAGAALHVRDFFEVKLKTDEVSSMVKKCSLTNVTGYAEGSDLFRKLSSCDLMAPLVDGWDYGSWSAVYNALSFAGCQVGGKSTTDSWLRSQL